jgi:predicted nucleotidyltransferase
MSGVTGADRVKSRNDFQQFVFSYSKLINQFFGFRSMVISGSYNSDIKKQEFGDIDLIVHIDTHKTKQNLKKDLQTFFHSQLETVIVPFTSPKYNGKRSYNSGEIVTIRYFDSSLGYSVQIDNIIALDTTEANFKQQFLDFPASKQGLILGLVKTATVEKEPKELFARLGIDIAGLDPGGLIHVEAPFGSDYDQEYEFNLSSSELQLRKVTYVHSSYTQAYRTVIWRSQRIQDLATLLYQYDLNADFNTLLLQAKNTVQNSRSFKRILGVYTSMVSVKSGEVGTKKGEEKTTSIEKVRQTFLEHA